MAFDANLNGITIQTVEEIRQDLNADVVATFGIGTDVRPNSPMGQWIGLHAEREAKVQAAGQNIGASYDPAAARGVQLDRIAATTGSKRRGVAPSTIEGSAKGADGTVIQDGKIVRVIQTQTQWLVVDGPYTIGDTAPGEVDINVQAVVAGPTEQLTAGTSEWEIVTAVPGWTTFESTEDADVGRDIESDFAFDTRRNEEIFQQGDDIAAVVASVRRVLGVTFVRVLENRSLITVDGVEGKAFETLVVGGDDTEIAEAIKSSRPLMAKSVGTIITALDDGEGGSVNFGHTRPTEIDIWLVADITIGAAQDPLPNNAKAAVEAALLAYGNANHNVADNVIPDSFIGTVYDVIGSKAAEDVTIRLGLIDFPGSTNAVISIASREIADFDSARVLANFI